MLSFHNNPKVKEFYVKRMAEHIAADELRQNYGYWKDGKGCSVGCTIHSSNHSAYERADGPGLPEWLARLQDTLFEGLDKAEARQFSADFFPAIPVGANLDSVQWQFCAFLMKEHIDRVLALDLADTLKEEVVAAIRQVLVLHEDAIRTGQWDESAAESAARAAKSAVESAARAAKSAVESAARAAKSAVESAARAAAWAAESAVESAVESAAWSAAWAAGWAAGWAAKSAVESAVESAAWSAKSKARATAFKRYADELLSLLRNAR